MTGWRDDTEQLGAAGLGQRRRQGRLAETRCLTAFFAGAILSEKWREADELKEKAIEAYRNEKHAIGKMYMKKWDAAVDEILALNKQIRDLNKE